MKKLLLLPLLFLSLAQAETIQCKVVAVVSGDTLVCLDEREKRIHIRLEQIKAPIIDQPYGKEAKKALTDMAYGKNLHIDTSGKDRDGWLQGTVYQDINICCGLCLTINEIMVDQGYAWYDPFAAKNKSRQVSEHQKVTADAMGVDVADLTSLLELEQEAREAKRGLWADKNPVAPWEYRKQKKEKNEK